MSERTSAEDALQSSELAARLLRRLTASPGVIDTQRLYKTYARLTKMITHAHPLLHDLLARYFIASDSTLQDLPLVMDQPWMLNLNTYLTNNSAVSSTTNNSFFTSIAVNQSILQSTTSSTTNTNVFGATSQPAPPEKFRISRRPSDRRESVPVDVHEDVLNPVPQRRAEPVTQSLTHSEEKPLTLANRETRISEARLIGRPVPPSVPTLTNPALVQPPLALPVIQRELRDSEIKTTRLVLNDNERIKIDRHSTKSEERHETKTSQTKVAVTEVRADAIPTTLPLAQAQIPASQFESRPQQLIFRKSADTQTLRELVADVSSSSSLAAVRQAIDALPVAQTPPSAPMMSPESSFREAQSRGGEEITTEGMLRRISKMLLIERERRGY